MACVFLLGPKTNYGESEQNPAYWLQLFLATKQCGAKVTWYDPVKDRQNERCLSMRDWVAWVRFFMSFLINGVGFHILVHALPIQVAAQSTLTGVVFRAVGMMYLVDLDDTPGYTLTIVQQPTQEPGKEDDGGGMSLDETEVSTPKKFVDSPDALPPSILGEEAQKIMEEARQKLEALAHGEVPFGRNRMTNNDILVGGALINGGQFEDGDGVGTVEPAATSRDISLG